MERLDLYTKGKNFFGDRELSPLSICAGLASDEQLKSFLESQLRPALQLYQIDFSDVLAQVDAAAVKFEREPSVLSGATHRRVLELVKVERELESTLQNLVLTPNEATILEKSLVPRAQKCAAQVRQALEATHLGCDRAAILDLGCGDGLVAKFLVDDAWSEDNRRVTLADVMNYLDADLKRRVEDVNDQTYEFISLPYDYENLTGAMAGDRRKHWLEDAPETRRRGYYDLGLMLTVLHHSSPPSYAFAAGWEAVADRVFPDDRKPGALVVIESCIGIDAGTIDEPTYGHLGASPSLRGGAPELLQDSAVQQFIALGENVIGEDQRRYATFVDWFYNRVIHRGVFVPCNFASPRTWNKLFKEFDRVAELWTFIEGFDQPIVPEFHTIHVIEFRNGN